MLASANAATAPVGGQGPGLRKGPGWAAGGPCLFLRHGIRRLPGPKPAGKKKKFKDYSSGYLRVDPAEVHTQEGKAYSFVATDRTGKRAFAEVQPRATKMLVAIPYKVHKVLTGNST